MKNKTIACPICKVKQTGVVRISHGKVTLIPSSEHSISAFPFIIEEGTPYIRCCVTSCQHLLLGDELEKALTPVIKFPSEIKEAREEVLV